MKQHKSSQQEDSTKESISSTIPLRDLQQRHDSRIISCESDIHPLCRIGEGGFVRVILVRIEGIDSPCVLKILPRVCDDEVLKACGEGFDTQMELFTTPQCFNRIPRPICILDLLDEHHEGAYGFCTEFCIGGNVREFSKSWCDVVGGKSYGYESDEDKLDTVLEPMTLDPLRVSALCVGMIE
ncbi:hypothetical protein ADUPG1_009548, partial [Aduncisulcus paluster]